jgi:hypothetical protein
MHLPVCPPVLVRRTKGSDVNFKRCSFVLNDSDNPLTRLYTRAKIKPIMAMERFQRCRELFTDFRSFQGDLSLLDGPARGICTRMIIIRVPG